MILGLDISSSSTGFGILEPMEVCRFNSKQGLEIKVLSKYPKVIEFGQFRPTASMDNPAKYAFMAFKICELSKEFPITDIIIESYFVSRVMGQSTFVCAEARGAIKAAIAMFIPKATIHPEVSPSSLKKCITGNGHATKEEVGKTILNKLGIEYTNPKGTGKSKFTFMIGEDKYYDDCTDALALAYYHYLKGSNA